MKSQISGVAAWLRLVVVAAFVLSTWHSQSFQTAAMKTIDEDDGATNDPDIEDTILDSTIQSNPDYVERNSLPDVDGDDDEDESDEDDDSVSETINATRSATTKATKSMVSMALSKPKKAIRLLRKHKATILMVLVVYAFRRELLHFFYKLVSAPIYGEGGKVVGRSLTINPTSILKLIFFLQFVMRSLSITGGSDGSPSVFPMDQRTALPFPHFNKPYIHVPQTEQHWTFERLNERFDKDSLALHKALGEPPSLIYNTTGAAPTSSSFSTMIREVLQQRNTPTKSGLNNGTAIVMDLTKLTSNLVQMDWIRDQVSFILSQHHANQTTLTSMTSTDDNETSCTAQMEVIILLESPGGGAADYGLASSQLLRLRKETGITLTICVDKVAASGGYMMAATGHQILAAPFAVLGSIGVYGQAINIHNLLEGWGVKDLIFRAGKNKAPLGLLGEVTKAGRETIQTMIDATHVAFKSHIVMARPTLAPMIDNVATGDVWLGYDALDVGLVDRLVTSDEYIEERMQQGTRVLKLIRYKRPSLFFGTRTQSPDYSAVGWVRSVVAELKNALIGTIEDESSDVINARSLTANTVTTHSPISSRF